MSGYIVSPEAESDVFEIWSYLAKDAGVALANQIEAELFDDFELLARSPGIGYKRQDLTAFPVFFYRAFPYQYMVIYRKTTPLEIVGVSSRQAQRVENSRGTPRLVDRMRLPSLRQMEAKHGNVNDPLVVSRQMEVGGNPCRKPGRNRFADFLRGSRFPSHVSTDATPRSVGRA